MYDTIIIGSGPAGISASIYLYRANINVLVLTTDSSMLKRAKTVENYYGFSSVSGEELYEIGKEHATKLGVEIKTEEVTSINVDKNCEVITANNKYIAKTVILATGVKQSPLNIKNLKEYDGRGISSCSVCDGFFFKNRNIGLIGNGDYAAEEINYLKNITNNITIFTNGEEYNSKLENFGFEMITNKITAASGDDRFDSLVLDDDRKIELDGLFLAYGSASTLDFAKKLGIIIESNYIKVNDNYETNIDGIYAIGDAIGGLKQISKAVYDGANISQYIIKKLREENIDANNRK